MEDCLFCKIVARKIPAEVVFESEDVLGFKDVRPQAPTHDIFVPKRHVSDVRAADGGKPVMDPLVAAANRVARERGVSETGYRLVVNCGADAGQSVDHLHLHLLAGRHLKWPPG